MMFFLNDLVVEIVAWVGRNSAPFAQILYTIVEFICFGHLLDGSNVNGKKILYLIKIKYKIIFKKISISCLLSLP